MLQWITLPNGRQYFVTEAYVRGARDVRRVPTHLLPNPYKPSPEYAQYRYGGDNERAGYHDAIEEGPLA